MRVVFGLLKFLGVLVLLALLAGLIVFGRGWDTIHADHGPALAAAVVHPDTAAIARGRHLADVVCAGCHSPDGRLPLAGGRENLLAIPHGPVFGELHAPNLTPGGRLAEYDDAELVRAIREGVGRERHGLLVMPSAQFHDLGDADLGALIAFLRSQPAVRAPRRERRINLLAYLVLGAGMFRTSDTPPETGPVGSPPPDTTEAYGRYLVRLGGCGDCHGADYRGARPGQLAPHGPDLVTLASMHPRGIFDRALRQGISASGRALDPSLMPFPSFARLDDREAHAIHVYLRNLGRAIRG